MDQHITISLTDANTPPMVLINGERYPINAIDYQYETDTTIMGEHSLVIKYADKDNNQIVVTGFQR